MLKTLIKGILHGVFLTLAFPMAALSLFGRMQPLYRFFAQSCALVPGLLGGYLRMACYKLTLEECALQSRSQFGSFFAHPRAKVGRLMYIGSYCVPGRTAIGDRTQIASLVQVLSGPRQHARHEHGRMLGSEYGAFDLVTIGASAIVLADLGAGSTLGARSVVTNPVSPGSVAVGNPARVIKTSGESAG